MFAFKYQINVTLKTKKKFLHIFLVPLLSFLNWEREKNISLRISESRRPPSQQLKYSKNTHTHIFALLPQRHFILKAVNVINDIIAPKRSDANHHFVQKTANCINWNIRTMFSNTTPEKNLGGRRGTSPPPPRKGWTISASSLSCHSPTSAKHNCYGKLSETATF